MNYATIKTCDIANGTGVRVSLFVSGCTHHCPGCFNSQAWDFTYGEPFDEGVQDYLLSLLSRSYIEGLTLLGGEPFETENQRALLPFLERVKRELPEKTIWAYSGYTYEQLTGTGAPVCEATEKMLGLVDVLVDGRFIEEKKNIRLLFRGSENQRIIDMAKTRATGAPVLWEEPKKGI